ncbi:hypothetical protein MRX96_026914 [Rhipicephalus microplus]
MRSSPPCRRGSSALARPFRRRAHSGALSLFYVRGTDVTAAAATERTKTSLLSAEQKKISDALRGGTTWRSLHWDHQRRRRTLHNDTADPSDEKNEGGGGR